jgi:hypothetical protein
VSSRKREGKKEERERKGTEGDRRKMRKRQGGERECV